VIYGGFHSSFAGAANLDSVVVDNKYSLSLALPAVVWVESESSSSYSASELGNRCAVEDLPLLLRLPVVLYLKH
jgi:hypothetical protein